MERQDLYAELRCKCCNKTTKKLCVGTSDNKVFNISDIINKLYTDICKKCKKCTVWEVVAYLGIQ